MQGKKGQEESLNIVKAQITNQQKQTSASSDKSREAQAQSRLANKLNKVKLKKDIKVELEVWKT